METMLIIKLWRHYKKNNNDFNRDNPDNPISEAQYKELVPKLMEPFGAEYKDKLIQQLTEMRYRASALPSDRSSVFYRDALDDISGDTIFKCPLIDFTEEYAGITSGKVYQVWCVCLTVLLKWLGYNLNNYVMFDINVLVCEMVRS